MFGVRACDARSFTILDKVFLGRPGGQLLQVPPRARHHRDAGLHRSRRRPASAPIFGIDPAEPEGDAPLLDGRSDALYLEANTEKGEEAARQPVRAADESGGAAQGRRAAGGDSRRSSKSCPSHELEPEGL